MLFEFALIVPEWQLPIQEEEPPDNEPILYGKTSSDLYNENISLSRLQHNSDNGITNTFGAAPPNREQNNASSSTANNLISLTRDTSMDVHKNNNQAFSVSGSQSSLMNKVVQPPTHSASHQHAHLGHDDMEMCSDEEDETTKESQFSSFGHSKFEQRLPTNTPSVPPPHIQTNAPPFMSEEEFNRLRYNTSNPITIPPTMDNPPMNTSNSRNGMTSGVGPFSNPPPSFGVGQTSQTQFSQMTSPQPSRPNNPYLLPASKELTKEEQEEEKKTQSLQDRLRSLAGLPSDNQSEEKRQPNLQPNMPISSYPAPKGQEQASPANSFSHGRGSSNRGSLGTHHNEFRGGHVGGPPFSGPRGMMRPHMGGNWRGSPRPALPMRGMRGGGRARPGPRW